MLEITTGTRYGHRLPNYQHFGKCHDPERYERARQIFDAHPAVEEVNLYDLSGFANHETITRAELKRYVPDFEDRRDPRTSTGETWPRCQGCGVNYAKVRDGAVGDCDECRERARLDAPDWGRP